MSTKMSKEDCIKNLKSTGLVSDEMLSKISGGDRPVPKMVPSSVPCPYCHGVEENMEMICTDGEHLGFCGGEEWQSCDRGRPFYIVNGKGVKVEDYKKW